MDFTNYLQELDWVRFGIKSLIVALIIFGTILSSKLIKGFVQRQIDKSTIDMTHLNFIKHILSGGIYLIGFILILFQSEYLKSISISILASSGIIAVIIGFASQQTFANVVSGLFMSFFKPFRIGDRIRFIDKNTMGIVEDITLRHTIIRTFENKRIIIPNNIMNNEMIENANIIDDKTCSFLDIGISYDSNINLAFRIIQECVLAHPDYYDHRDADEIASGKESIEIKVIGLGDSSIDIRAWIWSKDPATGFSMLCDLRKVIKERFDREGVEIPYPHRSLVIKNNS